ncbi:MAG: type IV toxin-antitoxin system AbiEi family antitoxin [Thermodesulfovibrionia bacterium]|nr:type IV toxin-antitoxin system AbiEi family antitoxin [Thermodesulfovibrionia bacterium]
MNVLNKNIEQEIFQLAFEALRKIVPVQVEAEAIQPLPGFKRPDMLLRMVIQGKELHYYAEVKTTVTKANKLLLLLHKEKLTYPLLLITKYVNTYMAEQLRQDGVEFIDTAGNAFFNQPPLYIFIKGNRPPEAIRKAPLKRAFKPTGLRMIYAFLCNPGLENKTYREIAAETDVALGTVAWIMKELKELGFLLDMGKQGQKLIHKENLLQRWVTAYPEQLRPKQMLGRYRGEYGWWQQKKLDPLKAQWGGEVAAARLTQYLKPELITIYTTAQQINQLLLENRLRKDPAGDVEVLERFWKPVETLQYADLVHPILVYADLIATGNQRNIEIAKIIYEQNIIRLIRED